MRPKNTSNSDPLIWVRGAGEMASATAITLFRSGFNVFLSELKLPLAIRRTVTFSDAMMDGEKTVLDIVCKKTPLDKICISSKKSFIPIIEDNPGSIISLSPNIIIDARMKKTYHKDYRSWADLVIGYGPGFSTHHNCHIVVETMRGHNLGKLIYDGEPSKNTGIPGTLGGESMKRVIYAPSAGKLTWDCSFGDQVEVGQTLGYINASETIQAQISGIVRGLIHPNVPITDGLKIGDIDPRGKSINYHDLSDKARSLGRASLEAVMQYVTQSL